jgi:tetratricopeptide (TPR) repeat protein
MIGGVFVLLLAAGIIAEPTQSAQSPRTPATARKAPAPSPVAQIEKQADAARAAGRLEDAVGLYRKGLAIRPRWPQGLWHLGTSLYELERWTEARDAFAKLLRVDPKHGAAYAFKGLCEFRLKNYQGALDDLLQSKALGVSGDRDLGSVARFHAGIILSRLEQYEAALNTLGEFTLDGNDSPQVIEAMGIAALRLPLLPIELPADKREMVLMAGRASYYMAARLVTAADGAFQELVTRYPEAPNVHYAYGVFLLPEQPDKAIEQLTRELKLSPNHVYAMLHLAFEYIKRGDYEAAKTHADRAVELAPLFFVAHKALGQIQLELGDVDGAIASLETSRRLAADSPSVRFSLARAYQRAGRAADAERERGEFARLDRLARIQKSGVQAVGGIPGEDRTKK